MCSQYDNLIQSESAVQTQNKSPISENLPGLLSTDTYPEAGRKTLRFHFHKLIRHEPGTRSGDDIESLHEMRVATRRMRAAFELFRTAYIAREIKPLRKGLRKTGRALGRIRDFDVFIENAENHQNSLDEMDRGKYDPLISIWRSRRTEDRKLLLTYLDSKKYKLWKYCFNAFVDSKGFGVRELPMQNWNSLKHIAPTMIYTRYCDVLKYDPNIPELSIPELHSLRLQFKQLRYTIEFFKEILGSQTKRVIKVIKKIQDHLGDLNDADVACKLMTNVLSSSAEDDEYKILSRNHQVEVLKRYLEVKTHERIHLSDTFREVWLEFSNREFFENLSDSLVEIGDD
jgi:CHAD domain-containing protein